MDGIAEGGGRGQRPPWFWPSGMFLIAGLVGCGIIAWIALVVPAQRTFSGFGDLFNPSRPSAATWKPSVSQYCAYIGDYNSPPGLNENNTLMAALLANSAPTPASHAAALHLYDAIQAKRITQANVDAVNGAYTCPSTSRTD